MHPVRCEYFTSLIQLSLCKFSLASFSSDVCERDVGVSYSADKVGGILDEACSADDLATVTERAKACARKWGKIV